MSFDTTCICIVAILFFYFAEQTIQSIRKYKE